jgi:Zn-dependent protease with chaperone function
MAAPLLLAAFTLPGIITAAVISRYYKQSEVTGRYRYLPLDKPLERQISRKLEKTWGQKMRLRHKNEENELVHKTWQWVKKVTKLPDNGTEVVFDTDEEVFKVFHTGNLYVSKGIIRGLNEKQLKELFLHEAGHVVLSHQQEGLLCMKISALVLAYLCRHNHHFHYILKEYQMENRFSQLQEKEVNLFASRLMENYKSFNCVSSFPI